jgi:hypothetical protein
LRSTVSIFTVCFIDMFKYRKSWLKNAWITEVIVEEKQDGSFRLANDLLEVNISGKGRITGILDVKEK